jgi:hypothetical protein
MNTLPFVSQKVTKFSLFQMLDWSFWYIPELILRVHHLMSTDYSCRGGTGMIFSTSKNRIQVKDNWSEPCAILTEQERIIKLQKGNTFLSAFAKLRKATISFVVSVRPNGKTRLPLDGFS